LLSDLKIERRAILDALDEASDRRRKTGEAVRKPAVSAKPSKKRGRKQAKDDECENDVMALYEKRQGSPNVYYSIADDLKSKYPGMTPKQAEKIKRRVMGRRERAKGVTKSRVRPRRNS
jgi:hypothetical protein